MSITEIQGPLSAATKRMAKQDRMFGNLPEAGPKGPTKRRKKKEPVDSFGVTLKERHSTKGDRFYHNFPFDGTGHRTGGGF